MDNMTPATDTMIVLLMWSLGAIGMQSLSVPVLELVTALIDLLLGT